MSGIAKEDVDDLGFVDAVELASTGSAVDEYRSDPVTDVVSGTITISGLELWDNDKNVQSGDIFVLSGATAGDGSYTVNTIDSATEFTVNEAIVDSTGGTASFRHPAGAERVGVDPTNLTQSAAGNLQTVLEDIDAAVTSGGITESEHRDLNTLLHALDETHESAPTFNADGVMTLVESRQTGDGPTIRQHASLTKDGDGLITGLVVTQHDEAGATVETLTFAITIVGGVPTLSTVTRT